MLSMQVKTSLATILPSVPTARNRIYAGDKACVFPFSDKSDRCRGSRTGFRDIHEPAQTKAEPVEARGADLNPYYHNHSGVSSLIVGSRIHMSACLTVAHLFCVSQITVVDVGRSFLLLCRFEDVVSEGRETTGAFGPLTDGVLTKIFISIPTRTC